MKLLATSSVRRFGVRLVFSVALLAGLPIAERDAAACSPSRMGEVLDGLGGPRVTEVPRNYAYVRNPADRVRIAGSPVDLFRDAELLPVGPLAGTLDVVVRDRVDSTRPERSTLSSGILHVEHPDDDNDCFANTTRTLILTLDADPADDQTPPRQLTYAIYTGATKAEAETAATPVALRVSEQASIVPFPHSGRAGADQRSE